MFNFTKKHRNALADATEQAAQASEKYAAAIKQIERLEAELSQSHKAQIIMIEDVQNCVASLYTIQSQLQAVAVYLEYSDKHIVELTEENRVLSSSADEWLRRAIKLEFEVLTAKDQLKKIENERDLTVKMYQRLQAQLMSADKKNNRD